VGEISGYSSCIENGSLFGLTLSTSKYLPTFCGAYCLPHHGLTALGLSSETSASTYQ